MALVLRMCNKTTVQTSLYKKTIYIIWFGSGKLNTKCHLLKIYDDNIQHYNVCVLILLQEQLNEFATEKKNCCKILVSDQ